jgi:glycosyltransferase involved in cell wall biosynthesis
VIHGQRVVVVMPAYRAERTLAACYRAIPHDVVDAVVLVDDASDDATIAVAESLGLNTVRHAINAGYGANQKTCYSEALRAGADIVVMVHPDYQYEPRLITALASLVASGVYDVALGSRMLGKSALKGGMPRYKYHANKFLTAFQNLMTGAHLSEYHTGYRAYSRRVLETLPLGANSSDFLFDNQMLVQALAFDMRIGEVSCPTRYFEDASQISLRRSIVYGFGVLRTSVTYRLWRWGLAAPAIFSAQPEYKLTHPALITTARA